MAQSMQLHVFPYIDRCKTIPGLKIEAGLTSLNKNHEAVVEITVLTHFLFKEADIEYGLLKRLSQSISNNRLVLAQVQP